MKKIICLLLSAVLCVSLFSGCAGEDKAQTTAAPEVQTTAAETEAVTLPPETTVAPTEETEPLQIHLRFSELEMTALNETCRLYNGTVDDSEVTFGSDNEDVVTFENGIAVCHGAGTAVVFAEFADQRLECTVTCTLPTRPTYPPEGETGIPEPDNPDGGFGGGSDPVMAPPTTFNVDSSFFDDALFIGDSLTEGLSLYASGSGALGSARIVYERGYSIYHASGNSMSLTLDGQSYDRIEDLVAASGANKLFIMLGVNDMVGMGMEETVSNWRSVLGRIQSSCPGLRIFIESATPIYTAGQTGLLTNERVDTLNMNLMGIAGEYGATFLNIAPYLKDGTNGMADRYCSDNYVHLTFYDSDSGTGVWVKAMKHLITG